MGQTLSFPAMEKKSESGGNKRFAYAVSEMQGWRISMEDAHAIVLNLDEGKEDSNTFFAVYDGHGGGSVAKFAGENVHKRLIKEESYHGKQYETAMKRAFLGTDEDLLANPSHTRDPSGCTAVAALLTNDGKIYVANAGDSRSVLSVKGEVKPLSFDHKPSNDVEKARISGAGGYIEYGRVNGNLALSRALGDFEFKKNYGLIPENQIITANPDVLSHDITQEDEFMVLACDGIWDCMSSQEVVNFIRRKVYEGKELSEIGELMCDNCLAPDTSSGAGIGCDNMTVLIVAILNGRTKEEWYSWIHDRVEKNYGYETPPEPPQIYSLSRLKSFKVRRESMEERERLKLEREKERENDTSSGSSGFIGFAKVLGGTGGISFYPGSGIRNDSGGLMFDSDDDSGDEAMEADDLDSGRSFFGDSLGLGRPDSPDATKNLRAQLEEFERDSEDEDGDALMVDESEIPIDGDTDIHAELPPPHPQSPEPSPPASKVDRSKSETPPPRSLPNGDFKTTVEQLKSLPGGDEPSPAVKAEGFLDSSEDPLKLKV